jgi:hypothetical protein
MKMSNKLYDILNKLQRWIPSLAVFYLALCKIWGLALGQQVSDTLMAIAALLAATLEISTAEYNKTKVQPFVWHDHEIEDKDE